jgi:hypothetical protein
LYADTNVSKGHSTSIFKVEVCRAGKLFGYLGRLQRLFYYYYFSDVRLSPLGTAAATDLLYQQLVELRLAGETDVRGENLLELHFVHHKSHLTRHGLEPGAPRWEASD